jgi:hypothetical protein
MVWDFYTATASADCVSGGEFEKQVKNTTNKKD